MKRALIRAVTAAALGVSMVVGIAVPASAQPIRPNVDPGTVVAAVKAVYSIYQKFAGGGGLSLADAVQQIEDQIRASQTAIIDEIDRVAASGARYAHGPAGALPCPSGPALDLLAEAHVRAEVRLFES